MDGRFLLSFSLFMVAILLGFSDLAVAQQDTAYTNGRYLYRPYSSADSIIDSDSLLLRAKIDSLEMVRMQFIRDSIEAREIFIRDSIARREHILDSLKILKDQLPQLLEAALKTFTDNFIVSSGKIHIIGDSMLSNYVSKVLPLTTDQPFTPWQHTVNLSDKPAKLTLNAKTNKIATIQSPGMACSFEHNPRGNMVKITGKGIIASNASVKVYKTPIDSVFFDTKGRVIKVKRSVLFSTVVNSIQQGAPLFTHLSQVKQYEYSADNELAKFEIVNFCDRKSSGDPKKVCFMVTYSLIRQGNIYIMTRRNDPANEFSDGTFTYEFDNQSTLKSIAFLNFQKTEDRKTFIELNEDGNVGSYVYQNKGIVKNTLLFNYSLNDPKAKYKIENISCTFDEDGVSYYQVNNTTGKSRVRDRLTMEWSPWR